MYFIIITDCVIKVHNKLKINSYKLKIEYIKQTAALSHTAVLLQFEIDVHFVIGNYHFFNAFLKQ